MGSKQGLILLLVTFYTVLIVTIGTTLAATMTVGGGVYYTSIQAAMEDANDGDTILVYPGTYYENVDVNKQLRITSTDGASVTHVIAVSSDDHVFEVTADNVTISGFNVNGATGYYQVGIYLSSSSNSTLIDNTVSNNGIGIMLYSSSNNTLTNNDASNNGYGIRMIDSNDNSLLSNTVLSNTYDGIYLSRSGNNTLVDNTVSDNYREGISLSSLSNNNTLINNYITNNDDHGIYLSRSGNNTLTSNYIAHNAYGIYLGEYASGEYPSDYIVTCNNKVTNNYVVDNSCGIHLRDSNHNHIYNNFFSNLVNTDFSGTNTGNVWTGGTMKLLINSEEKYTLRTGSALELAEGYVLTTKQIDVEGDKVWMEFSKDGILLGDEVIDAGSGEVTWDYEVGVGDHDAVALLSVLVTDIFQGQVDSLVVVEGLWLVEYENSPETKSAIETNIVGGPYLGGNYWATPDNDGFSQTCVDKNSDGICDSSYFIDSNHIDYLPLALHNVIFVDDSGAADYTSIQAAVDAANLGTTILVFPGMYNENVDVDKQLNVVSILGASVTNVIAKSAENHVFKVTADGVTINGFSVSGAIDNYNAGICLWFTDNCKLTNNIAANNDDGITLHYSNNNTLINNNVLNNYDGINLYFSSNNTLTDNTADKNERRGIKLLSSNNNMLTDNNATDNGEGIYLYSSSKNTLVNSIAADNFNGIDLSHSSNNTLTNNIAADNDYNGILLYHSSNNKLTNSIVTDNSYGILRASSSNNQIYNNFFSNSINTDFSGTNTGNVWTGGTMKLLFNSEEKYTLKTGSVLNLAEGYALTAKKIDVEGDKVWMEFSKNGILLGDEVIDVRSDEATWDYEVDVGDHDDVIRFRVLVTNVFQGHFYSLVSVEGLWLVEYKNSPEAEPTHGTNIVGGPSIGGNYWATPDNDGFSQTCNDTNDDGFCDSIYVLGANNTDYLPLKPEGKIPKFVDSIAPVLYDVTPINEQKLPAGTTTVDIRFNYSDIQTGINASALVFTFDGADVTANATITDSYVSYNATGLTAGTHSASVYVIDYAENSQNFSTSFSVEEMSIIGISGSMAVLSFIAILLATAFVLYRERR